MNDEAAGAPDPGSAGATGVGRGAKTISSYVAKRGLGGPGGDASRTEAGQDDCR